MTGVGRERGRRTAMIAGIAAVAIGLAGAAVPGTAVARTAALPKACQALEALVSDEVDGPDAAGGEVLRFSSSVSQGTLTNNLSPAGGPTLDSPEDMAFDTNGDIVTADMGITTGVSQVVRVNRTTGVRTLVAGTGVGTGTVVNGPFSIAVTPSNIILVLDFEPTTYAERLIQITPSGVRSVLSSGAVGAGAAFGSPNQVRVVDGQIYLVSATQVVSVNAVNGTRTLVSGGGRGTGAAFADAVSATSDSTGSIMVLDQAYGGTGALIRVNLATGDRSVLSANGAPSVGPAFAGPYDVVHNACDNSFYFLNDGPGGLNRDVVRVDGVNGKRSMFATYRADAVPNNYSLLMRPLIVTPGGGSGGSGGGGNL